jgi:tetratricopeptide (TPR) repeat protein
MSAGRYQDAVNILRKATEENPDAEQAWLLLGVAHRHVKNLKAAVADESKAIQLAPSDAGAWTSRATIENDLGWSDRAVADATQAIRLDGGLASAYTARGAAGVARRDFAGAERDLTRAIDLDPRQPDAWLYRGQALEARNKSRQSAADFVKFMELSDPKASDPDWKHVLPASGRKPVTHPLNAVDPRFPRFSRGDVRRIVIGYVIGTNGLLRRIVPLVGSAEYIQPAVDAMRGWRFSPPVENGQPVEAIAVAAFEVHGG